MSSAPDRFAVTYWGVRGTLASPGKAFSRTGGNTICAALTCGARLVIFDSGTGIRELGSMLMGQSAIRQVDLMLTHVHYDHVEGLPFFAPFFSKEFSIRVWLGHVDGARNTEEAVKGLMRRPYFPVGPEVFQASTAYNLVERNAAFSLGDGIAVRTCPLNHPGGATAYRIDFNGRSYAFVTDVEHTAGRTDPAIVDLVRGVGVFAYDSSFSDAELADYAGFGHSTFEEGLRVRAKAGAGAFHAIHHMPFRTDDEINAIEAAIRARHPGSGVAREGDTYSPAPVRA
jgi:phosphoribosyl 1,2-cyclic phosphodiesterase